MRSRSRKPSLRSVALAGAVALAWAGVASAGEPWVDLRWDAPAGCPSAADVDARVDSLLGGRADRPATRSVVSAAVSRRGDGFHVRLEIVGEGAPRVREIDGPSCAAIANASALILALMIDPLTVQPDAPAVAEPAESPAPAAPSPPPVEPEKPVSVPPPDSPRGAPRVPLSLRARASAGLDAGSLPGVSGSLAIAAALHVGAQRVELGGAWWPGSTTLAGGGASGGDVDLAAASLATCRALVEGAIGVAPCVGIEVGRLHAAGFGVSTPGEGEALWTALRGGAEASYAITPRLGVALRVEAVAPLARPRFVIEGLGAVHRSAPVAGRAALGVDLTF